MIINRKYQVIVFLSMVVVVMSMIRWRYGYKEVTLTETQPTPTETKVAPVKSKTVDPEYPLWEILPYSGRGFVVEKYAAPLQLVISVRGLDEKLAEAEVNKWLEEQGPRGANHKIIIKN